MSSGSQQQSIPAVWHGGGTTSLSIEPKQLSDRLVTSGSEEQHVASVVTNSEGQVGEAYIEITPEKIDMWGLTERVASTCPAAGAIATFIGTTRNYFRDREVVKLSYTAYTSMAMKEMINITRHIFSSFAEVHRVVISHKIGECPVGEASVFIAVASGHRDEGLEACAYAINTLKAKVPVWKLEHYADGSHSQIAQGCMGCGRKPKTAEDVAGSSACSPPIGGHGEVVVVEAQEEREPFAATQWKRNVECTYKPPS